MLAEPKRASPALRCRTIADDDLDAVVGLLMRGFPDRTEAYWRRGLARHGCRSLPDGYPRYGHLLEADGRPVGVLLTFHTAVPQGDRTGVRCNLSSWYVEPAYRPHATLLDTLAMRRPEVTYLNVSPAPSTWAMHEVRGLVRYCGGQMLAIPALSRRQAGAAVEPVAADDPLGDLPPFERDLVRDHQAYGCVVLLGSDREGRRPLVLQRRTIGLIPHVKRIGQVPCFQLIYARSADDVARFAAPLGRLLLRRHGIPLVVLDADGPVPGLVGRYFGGRAPKYARGPGPVRLGDLAYTELVLFGA